MNRRLVSILMLLVLLVGGACQLFAPPRGGSATSTPRAEAGWATSAQPGAPRLVERTPAPGEEQPLDAPLRLVFDQPMDHSSVEAALTISPAVKSELSWADDRTLLVAPASRLERGVKYRLMVAEGAQSSGGKALAEPLAFDFATVGYLAVSEVQPGPDTAQLNTDATVTVVFNRPVVPLNPTAQQGALPDPLVFSPTVEGMGRWINTSIYVFKPNAGFLPATEYTAKVTAGLTDTTGGVLEEDYLWKFTTLRPEVVESWPPDKYAYFGPSDSITVTFNQPMDHASTEAAFALLVDNQPVKGSFSWSGGLESNVTETLVFKPATELLRGSEALLSLETTALGRRGGQGLTHRLQRRFSMVKRAGLMSSMPSDGEKNVTPDWMEIHLNFFSPMNTAVFTNYLKLTPPITDVRIYWDNDDTRAVLSFNGEPASAYRIDVDGAATDRYGEALGQPAVVRFETGDALPVANLNTPTSIGTFDAYTKTLLYATVINVSRLDFQLYRFPLEDFNRLNLENNWDWWSNYSPEAGNLVRSWSQELQLTRNRYALVKAPMVDAAGAELPPGLYYVRMTAPEVLERDAKSRSTYLFVKSKLNLTLKQTLNGALVWATDLATGRGAADLPLVWKRLNQPEVSGTTDAQGLCQSTVVFTDELWTPLVVYAGTPGADNFATAFNGWDVGLETWNFNLFAEYYRQPYRAAIYTDRPIYRPGQSVYFKAIVRADNDGQYALPGSVPNLTAVVNDAQGRTIYRETLTLNDMGTANGEIKLDAEAPLGYYTVLLQNGDMPALQVINFTVAEYRKPEYQIEVTTDHPSYISGDKINVTAQADYYFGGPVADSLVEWNLLADDYGFSYSCPAQQNCPWYDWSDNSDVWNPEAENYGGFGGLIAHGEGRTDSEGRFTLQLPADLKDAVRSQRFTIEINVTDINGQVVSQRTTVPVHKGDFYIGLAAQGSLAEVGEEKTVDLLAVAAPEIPGGESAPQAGQKLDVVFMEHQWYNVQKQSEDGRFYWTWEVEDVPVYTTTVTTGADGKATAAFTPQKAGTYRVRAQGRDARGHTISSSTYFWVWGGDTYVSWRQESNNRINLVADKRLYQVGDVAEILIPSPYSGTVQALVTVERGRIMQHEVRTLTGNNEVLRIPITEDFLPNVFVSVILVQGSLQSAEALASFKMGLVQLPVAMDAKQLQITLTPDKDTSAGEHYSPREKATYDVEVKDAAGEPVEAELSLRLADLAVLALADEQDLSLMGVFWNQRGLGVRTSSGLALAMEPFNRELAPGAKGGGGGGDVGLVRTNFADTAFWDATVRTDKNGHARVTVTLPDNLTTWRMQAKAVTADTRVGRTDVDIVSSLDLMVRPTLPRFFVVGDQAMLGTVIHNNSDAMQAVTVKFFGEGLALLGSDQQKVNVPAHDKAEVFWAVTVQAVDEVKVQLSAQAEGDAALKDAREDRLPVYQYSTPEVVATAGRLSESETRLELVNLPEKFDPTQGELTVRLDGSLTAAAQEGLSYLEHYPYECTEQTVSRFLPNVVTYQALEKLGGEREELKDNLTAQVQTGLQRLYANQHYDGGWGWWTTDQSDPYITAYVLQGLLEAGRAGFVVDAGVIEQAVAYLRENLKSPALFKNNGEANRLAYQLYVLGEYKVQFPNGSNGELGKAVRLFEERRRLDLYGKAYLARALSLLEPDEPLHVQTLTAELMSAAVIGATGTHWEEAEPDVWNMNTDIRSTAIVLWALAKLEPKSELLPHAVRWLMAMRTEGRWESTQDTAWSLLGLTAYMEASGELEGNYSYAVALNGEVLGDGRFDKDNLDEPQMLRTEIGELLTDEANKVAIQRQGDTGQLYYEVALRTYLPVEEVKPLNRGVVVGRQYSLIDAPMTPITQAMVGDVIQVKLTVVAPHDLYYVVVEDPLPAGCEAVDTSLKTTSVVGQAPEMSRVTDEADPWNRWGWSWGWWWFSYSELRDEKTALFATYLPRGTYEYTYLIRASVPGIFRVLPTTAAEMYFPEVFGRSEGTIFTVGDGGQ